MNNDVETSSSYNRLGHNGIKMNRLWILFFPVIALGCRNNFCLDGGCFEETGFGSFVCLEAPTNIVDFGEVTLEQGPQRRDLTFINNCDFDDSNIEWTLDDPSGVFNYAVVDKTNVQIRFSASAAGAWEAQFSGVHDGDQRKVNLQLFAKTVVAEEDGT